MTNNYWEEQDMPPNILDFHESLMSDIDLPEWIKNIKCPYCDKELPLRSVRNIQLCLNTRNFGDIAIEILCDDCSKMETLYFRTDCSGIGGFIKYLSAKDKAEEPTIEPFLEKDMYKMQYNNVAEKLIKVFHENNKV